MFMVGEWTSLSEVTQTIFSCVYQNRYYVDHEESPSEATADRVWAFLDEAQTIGVLTSQGSVVSGSLFLVEPPSEDRYEPQNSHVNIFVGTVGSALYSLESPICLDRGRVFYGPFLGCPILCKTDTFRAFLSRNYGADDNAPATSTAKLGQRGDEILAAERKGLGRRKVADGWAEIALVNYFRRTKTAEDLQSAKKESLKQEAIDWVRMVFDLEITRNTAANYLRPLWESGDAKK